MGFKEVSKQFRNTDSLLGRVSGLINRDNHIKIKSNSIDLSEIEIVWTPEFKKSKTIYKNKKETGKIGHIYGLNSFTILHNQNEVIKTGHFKTNNWHSHDYEFNIEKYTNLYIMNFEAKGPDQTMRIDTIPSSEKQNRIPIATLPSDSIPENSIQYLNEVKNLLSELNISKENELQEYAELFQRVDEIEFPRTTIPTKRELLSRIGFSVGQSLVESSNWKWKYIQWYKNEYIGWLVVSPNAEIGLAVEQYFFQADFYKKDIEFDEFIKRSNGKYNKRVNELYLYEPWKDGK